MRVNGRWYPQIRHMHAPRHVLDVGFADALDLRASFFELVPLLPARAGAPNGAADGRTTGATVEATIPMPFDEYPYSSAAPTVHRW